MRRRLTNTFRNNAAFHRSKQPRLVVRRSSFLPYLERLELRITPTVRVWTGIDGNLWSDALNWTGNVAPTSGDSLAFPSGAFNHTAANDYAAGTTFGSITIGASGYSLIGNQINLINGVDATFATGSSIDNLPTVLNNATYSVDNSGAVLTIGGAQGGSGGLIVGGQGTLILAGANANSYTGTTTVTGGTFELNKTAGTVAIPGGLTMGNGVNAANVVELNGSQLTGTATLTVNTNAAFILNGFSDTIGSLVLNGASLNTGSGTLTLNADLTVNTSATLDTLAGNVALAAGPHNFLIVDPTPSATPDLIILAALSGPAGFQKSGPGTLQVLGNNTYTGPTAVNAGILNAGSANALAGTSSVTIAPGGELDLVGGINVSAPVTVSGAGTTGVNAINSIAGTNTLSGAVSLAGNTSIGATSGQLSITGAITDGAGTFTFTKTGAGTLLQTNANTYDGGTNITAGILTTTNVGALGTGTATVTSGASLIIAAAGILPNNLILAGPGVGGAGSLQGTSGGTSSLTGNVTLTANTVISAASGGSAIDISGAVSDGGNSYGMTEVGGGTLTFSGSSANTYTGTTTVNAGVFNLNKTAGTNSFGGALAIGDGSSTAARTQLSASNQIPDTSSVTINGSNATLDLNVNNETVASLNMTGGTVLTGAGTLTLVGTLATNASPNTASVVGNLALPAVATITVAHGTGATDLDISGVISGAGVGLTLTGAGTTQFDGNTANTYAGTTYVNAGALQLRKSANNGTIGGNLVIGDHSGTSAIVGEIDNQITDASHVTVNEGATFNMIAASDVINSLSLQGGTILIGQSAALFVTSGVTSSVPNNHATSTIQGPGSIGLASNPTFPFTVASDPSVGIDLRVDALIQNGGVVKTGTGVLAFTANNTYAGATVVNGGVLLVESNNALGTSTGNTTVASGSAVEFSGANLSVPENFIINGTGIGGSNVLGVVSGSTTLTGTVDLYSDSRFGAVSGSTLTINGPVDDHVSTFNIEVGNGATGRTILGGNNQNFNGNMTALNGYLQAANNNATGAPASTSMVTLDNGASLELSGGITIPSTKTLDIKLNGVGGTASNVINAAGNNTDNGPIIFEANEVLEASSGTTLTLGGAISEVNGPDTLHKEGTGTIILAATNSYTGKTFVDAGTLIVNGSIATSSSVEVVGTLGGSGTVPNVLADSGALVAPGMVAPGILNTGSLSFITGSTYSVKLNGSTAGTGYDQLNVTGTVTLNNPTLSVSPGFAPVVGTVFKILNNDGNDAIVGTFNGLAEGANFTIGNQPFRVSYVGGDGNDATLTALTRIDNWSGLGVNSNWTNAANWLGGIAPVAGDRLVFPVGAAQTTNTNDFTAGTDFDAIVIASAGYTLGGNAVQLDNGISDLDASGTSTFAINTTLNASQTFTIATGGTLDFSGVLSSGPVAVITKAGGGTLSISSSNGATFNGNTTIGVGILSITDPSALGHSTTANVTVASGATLSLDLAISPNTINVASLSLDGTGVNGGGALVAHDSIVVLLAASGISLTATSTIVVGNGDGLDLGSSVISGATFGLNKAGGGLLSLGGANTYTGTTTVSAGTLWLNSGTGVRVPGDLVIDATSGSATARLFQANTIASASSVTLIGSGALLDLQGYSDTIGSLTFFGGSVTTGAGTLTLASGGVTTNANSTTATISGGIDLGNAIRTFTVAQGTVPNGGVDLSIDATISSSTGGIVKAGAGRMLLSGNNTYGGATTVTNGALIAASVNALGATTSGTSVTTSSATLEVNGGITLAAEPLVFGGGNSTFLSTGGNNVVPGPITFPPNNNLFISAATGTTLSLSGTIGGPGSPDVEFGDPTHQGTVVLSGNNTFNDYVDINFGTLVAASNTALGGTTNGIFRIDNGATLALQGGVTIADSISLLSGGGVGGLGALQSLNGANTYSGAITLFANSTIGVSAGTLTLNNAIGDGSNHLALTKAGIGTLVLSGTSTYGGSTTVSVGVLQVDGNIAASTVVDVNGGSLTGNGTVGNVVSMGGVLIPGDNPGMLTTSSVSLDTNSTFSVNLSGTVAGTGYSQLIAGGPISLGGAALQVFLGYSPVSGDQLTIIRNLSASLITGTFGGLVEGANFTSSGFTFRISYVGGAGHDVVLTNIATTTTTVTTSVPSPVWGQPVTFTADVSASSGSATGTVTFEDNGVALPNGAVSLAPVGGHQIATYSINKLGVGNHNITAVYSGVSLDLPSTGALASNPLIVSAATTTTQVSSSIQTSSYGQSVTFSALVTVNAPGVGQPGGIVTFKGGSSVIGTGNVNNLGIATYTTSTLQASLSSQAITAYYTPSNTNFTLSNSLGSPYLQTVNPATLSVTADNQTRLYGDLNPPLSYQYSGFVNGETLATSGVSGTPGVSTSATPSSPVAGSPYTISVNTGSLASGNYAFQFANGQLAVNKATLTVTADNQTRLYGDANPSLTTTFAGFKNGETLGTSSVSGTPALATSTTPSSPVAGSPYVITAAAGSLASGNYAFQFANGQLAVSPAPLTVTADNTSKFYGAALPALTATITGFVNGDNLSVLTGAASLNTTATTTNAVGLYPISVGVGSLSAANYVFPNLIAGTLTVLVNAAAEPGNFGGQGATLLAIVRPATDLWIIRYPEATGSFVSFGNPALNDVPVSGVYEGNGKTNLAVFRPSTDQWLIQRTDGTTLVQQFGDPASGDVPAPGDYEGIGKTDLAVFRPSTDQWIIQLSNGTTLVRQFGDPASGDVPVQGDYQGVGKVSPAVYRPSTGQWIIRNADGTTQMRQFGDPASGDIPTPGDYDGDGKTDLAVYRPSTASWSILKSSGGTATVSFGDPASNDLAIYAPIASLGLTTPHSIKTSVHSVTPARVHAASTKAVTAPETTLAPKPHAQNPWMVALDDLANELVQPFEVKRFRR